VVDVLEADRRGGDVAGVHFLDFGAVAGRGICRRRPMRSFAILRGDEHHLVARVQRPRVDPERRSRLPTNGSFRILKASAENGASVVGFFVSWARPRSLWPLDRRLLSRGRRHVFDDGVEHGLHALVLEPAEPQVTRQISFFKGACP